MEIQVKATMDVYITEDNIVEISIGNYSEGYLLKESGFELTQDFLEMLLSAKEFEPTTYFDLTKQRGRIKATEHVDKKLREMRLIEDEDCEIWRPAIHEIYWFIEGGKIFWTSFTNTDSDKIIIENGKYWQTEKEAEEYIKLIKIQRGN